MSKSEEELKHRLSRLADRTQKLKRFFEREETLLEQLYRAQEIRKGTGYHH